MRKLKKIPALVLGTMLVLAAGTTVYGVNRQKEKNQSASQAEAALKCTLKDGSDVIPYALNTSVNPLDLINAEDSNGKFQRGGDRH